MASARAARGYPPPDLLKLFFGDIKKLPGIAGRSDYIPLTRRIERGRVLFSVAGQDRGATLRRIIHLLQEKQAVLTEICPAVRFDDFVTTAAREIEAFLDDPAQTVPSSVACYENAPSSDPETAREEAWQCFYLLALLPPALREDHTLSPALLAEFSRHSELVQDEYKQCRETLITGTLRYVIRIALGYLWSGIPYLDLVQEGYFGLVAAADRFEERRGANYQQYASTWARQRLTRYIGDYARLIRVPVHQHEKTAAIGRQIRALTRKYGAAPSPLELAIHLGWLTQADLDLLQLHRRWQQHEAAQARLAESRRCLSYREADPRAIPSDIFYKVTALNKVYHDLNQELGHKPDEITLFVRLGWLSPGDAPHISPPDQPKPAPARVKQARARLRKARSQLRTYAITTATHHSLERTIIIKSYPTGKQVPIIDYLVAPDDPELRGEDRALHEEIQELLAGLPARDRDIINLRFGLMDGEDRTLEEVGQHFNITRERVRQIEGKVFRMLRRTGLQVYNNQQKASRSLPGQIGQQIHCRLLAALEKQPPLEAADRHARLRREHSRIERLIDQYIMRGRKRLLTSRRYGSRAQMCRKVLEQAGEPLHYSTIHDHILQLLPPGAHYPKDRTYATLFYSNAFQPLGNGVFGLAEWDYLSVNEAGERVLNHCPRPLLPDAADTRAFFESIMVGREILRRQPGISKTQFYAEMLAWAGQPRMSQQEQAAFDAWYAAGLFEYIDISSQTNGRLEAIIDPNARLNDVRMYCLNALCRRVRKMPELLLTLKTLARPTIPDIQYVLFGGDRAGFDVPDRLRMLAAFEAVRAEGGQWRLTPIGEAILQANPPQELPDFSVIDEVLANGDDEDLDDLAWEDGLGLLE